MSVKHFNKRRVPVDLEPETMEHVVNTANRLRLTRTKLLRILVKYGLENIQAAIQHGDKIVWVSPTPSDSKSIMTENPSEKSNT